MTTLTKDRFTDLRDRVLAGREALAEILCGCQEAVRRTARTRLRSEGLQAGAESWDAFQSVAAKFYDNAALDLLFRAPSLEDFTRALQAMVRNKVIDYVRREILRFALPIQKGEDLPAKVERPSERLQRVEETDRVIGKLLGGLNDDERQLFDLMAAEKTDSEIAAALKISQHSAKKRRQRFKERLRNRLAERK